MINNDTLWEILASWSFRDKPLPDVTPRSVAMADELSSKLATIIQGVRRCSKSTLLVQLIGHYDLNPKHCVFINFEDPGLSDHLDHTLLEAIYQ